MSHLVNPSTDLPEDIAVRAKAIAQAREEEVEAVLDRFDLERIRAAPAKLSHVIPSLRKARFEEAGVEDGLAYVVLENGMKLYGVRSLPYHEKIYGYVADLMPPEIGPETFLTAHDVTFRVLGKANWPPEVLDCPSNGTVVECGAFLGHKAVRFARELVPEGRVIAIEMMPDNIRILRRNIAANGLEDRVEVVEAGVWSERKLIPATGKGRQRNTIAGIERLSDGTGVVVEARRLDEILEGIGGLEVVDFLLVTVNGAEIEAIRGAEGWSERIGAVLVAAPYTTTESGRPNVEVVRELLVSQGFTLHELNSPKNVFATRRPRRELGGE